MLTLAFLILGGGLWPQPGIQSRNRAAEEITRIREGKLNPEKESMQVAEEQVAEENESKPALDSNS